MGDLNCFRSHCGGKMEFSYPSNTSLGLEHYPCMKWHKRISQIYIPNKFNHIDFISIAIFGTMIIQSMSFFIRKFTKQYFRDSEVNITVYLSIFDIPMFRTFVLKINMSNN